MYRKYNYLIKRLFERSVINLRSPWVTESNKNKERQPSLFLPRMWSTDDDISGKIRTRGIKKSVH